MRTPVKLAAFGAAVLIVFGAAFGVGAAVGSPIAPSEPTNHGTTVDDHSDKGHTP
jgi:hypothetical protein